MNRTEPYTAADVLTIYATSVVAGGLGLLAWWNTSGAVDVNTQVPWANVAILALVVAGTGNAVWLLRCRRAVGERRAAILPLGTGHSRRTTLAAPTTRTKPVAVAGATRYHDGRCVFVDGKAVRRASEAAHRRAGRRPCDFCQP